MGGHDARSYWEDRGLLLLIGSIVLPVLAWFADLQASYALVPWACRHNLRVALLLIPLGSLALVAVGAWMAWSCLRRLGGSVDARGGSMEARSYLLAILGLSTCAAFGLLILLSFVPRYVLSPCE